jgi:hypothetical protein
MRILDPKRFGSDLNVSSREADVVAAVRHPETTLDFRHVDSNGVEAIPHRTYPGQRVSRRRPREGLLLVHW